MISVPKYCLLHNVTVTTISESYPHAIIQSANLEALSVPSHSQLNQHFLDLPVFIIGIESNINPSDQYYWGEMTNPGLGFYSRHLTEDDVQVISANTRKLIFNNGQVKHELGNDRFKSSHCVMCLIECWY